jgi:hypothetical protein
VTDTAGHCSFCGATSGPFAKVEGLFTVLICIPCLEVRQAQPATRLSLHDPGPYPAMTRAEIANPGVKQLHPKRVNRPDAGRSVVDLARPARPVAPSPGAEGKERPATPWRLPSR